MRRRQRAVDGDDADERVGDTGGVVLTGDGDVLGARHDDRARSDDRARVIDVGERTEARRRRRDVRRDRGDPMRDGPEVRDDRPLASRSSGDLQKAVNRRERSLINRA